MGRRYTATTSHSCRTTTPGTPRIRLLPPGSAGEKETASRAVHPIPKGQGQPKQAHIGPAKAFLEERQHPGERRWLASYAGYPSGPDSRETDPQPPTSPPRPRHEHCYGVGPARLSPASIEATLHSPHVHDIARDGHRQRRQGRQLGSTGLNRADGDAIPWHRHSALLGTGKKYSRPLSERRREAIAGPTTRRRRTHHRLPQNPHLSGRRHRTHPRRILHRPTLTAGNDTQRDPRLDNRSPCVRTCGTRTRCPGHEIPARGGAITGRVEPGI